MARRPGVLVAHLEPADVLPLVGDGQEQLLDLGENKWLRDTGAGDEGGRCRSGTYRDGIRGRCSTLVM